MPLYNTVLTGRTRTLRFAGTISIPYYRADDTGPLYGNAADVALQGRADIRCGIYQIRIECYAGHIDGSFCSDGSKGVCTLRVTAPAPLNINYSGSVDLWPVFPVTSYGGTITGAYEIEIDVAEEMEVSGFTFPEGPWWNVQDGPATIVKFREKGQGSGNVRVNASFGSLSYANTFTRTDSFDFGGFGQYSGSLSCGINAREVAGGTVEIVAENTNLWKNRPSSSSRGGQVLYDFGAIGPPSVTNLSWSASIDTTTGAKASFSCAAGIPAFSPSFGSYANGIGCSVQQFVPIKTRFHAKTKCFEEDYPTAIRLLTTDHAGSFFWTIPPGGITEDRFSIAGQFFPLSNNQPAFYYSNLGGGFNTWGLGTNTGSSSIYPYTGTLQPGNVLQAIVDESSYVGGVDETSDPRIQGRGKKFGSVLIDHEPEATLEDFDGPGSFVGTNANLSGSSTLLIEATGSGAVAEGSFGSPVSTEAWRYWKIRIRSVGSDFVRFRMRVNGKKSFALKTISDGVWHEVSIDTCLPNKIESGVPAQQDSRWPLKGVSDNRPVNEAEHWGINYIEKLEFLGIANGLAVEIDWIKSERKASPICQFISAHYNGRVQWYNNAPAQSPDRRRHGLFLVDGRTGHELPDSQGVGLAYIDIGDYVSEINALNGWSGAGTDFGDPYFDDSLLSQFIGGEGAIWTADGYESYTNRQMSGSILDVPCQFLWDRMTIYPGIGDVWEDEGYDDPEHPINVRFLKFFRAAGHGLVFEGGAPLVGETVSIERTVLGDFRGSGVSDSRGFFTTELPYGAGNTNHTFKTATKELGVATLFTRKRQRMSELFTVPGRINPWNMQSWLGRLHRCHIEEGDVQYWRSMWSSASYGFDSQIAATSTGDCRNPRSCQRPDGRIILLYEREGIGIAEKYSDDEGSTWSTEEIIVEGGRHPMPVSGMVGYLIRACQIPDTGTEGPGVLQATIQGPGDQVPGAPVTITDENGDPITFADDTFGLCADKDGAMRWHLTAVVEGETAPSDWFSADETNLSMKRVS